jgi:membrane-associated phospholipid phosphatase
VFDFLINLDVSLYKTLNGLCGWSPTLDRIASHGEMLKGDVFMGIVGVLWFWPDKEMPRRRRTILITILGLAISLVANRILSTLLPFRVRPIYSIGANVPLFPYHADLENWSSFPSDNATYLFAIATGLWLASREWGLFFGVFAIYAALARVFFGMHYPSDIFAGALIGIVTMLLVNRETVRKLVAAPLLAFEARYPPYFYGLFFFVLAETSGLFVNVRGVAVAIVHIFTGYK